jgi:hypothetical protein
VPTVSYAHGLWEVGKCNCPVCFSSSLTVKMASRIVSSATVKAVKGRRPIQTRAALVLVCELKK